MPKRVHNYNPQPIDYHSSGLKIKKPSVLRHFSFIGISIGAFFVVAIAVFLILFQILLSPVNNDKSQMKKITIPSGSTSIQIGKELEKQSIIRNALAFELYVRFTGANKSLQAGKYSLSTGESTPQIINHLIKGSVNQFSITFFPGATLADTTNKPRSEKLDVTTVLENAGYSSKEIDTALNKNYNSPLFVDKPLNANLEGYVYGETYSFNVGTSVEDILRRTFDEFYKKIQEFDLISGFAKHGLDLHQGIILASIIQREDGSTKDQKQIAQVFYSRISLDMMLGSDPTYQYIADKIGVARDVKLDSPYNTRLYTGLPPGPISSPGLFALQAVANPAKGDYLYFLSGDDDITYFAHTNSEHEANISKYCKTKCSTQ